MPTRRLLVLLPALLLPVVATHPAHADAGWQWPLPPPHQVVRGFDPPARDWLAGHRGIDLAGRPGQRVLASGGGRVVFAGLVGRVAVVSIRHPDGLETTYEPVRPLVHAGSDVVAGAVLGTLLTDGSHCAPGACLHWGLRRGDAYLDPLTLVEAVRVRLLPLLSEPVPRRGGRRPSAAPPWGPRPWRWAGPAWSCADAADGSHQGSPASPSRVSGAQPPRRRC